MTVFFPAYRFNQFADFYHLVGVESGGGFVQDKHFGIMDQSLCQAYPLAVAFGEFPDIFMLFRFLIRTCGSYPYPGQDFYSWEYCGFLL